MFNLLASAQIIENIIGFTVSVMEDSDNGVILFVHHPDKRGMGVRDRFLGPLTEKWCQPQELQALMNAFIMGYQYGNKSGPNY